MENSGIAAVPTTERAVIARTIMCAQKRMACEVAVNAQRLRVFPDGHWARRLNRDGSLPFVAGHGQVGSA